MNRRMGTIALVTVLGAGISSAGIAFAQTEAGPGVQGQPAPGPQMQVEPTTVEPGGTYVISNDPGSPCLLGQVSGDTGGVRPGAWFVEPDETGSWSVTIEVPESGPPDASGNPTPFPEGEYEQHAFCEVPDSAGAGRSAAVPAAAAGQQEFAYDPVTVTVAAPEEPAAPPVDEAPTEQPAAQPATQEPSFTG